MCTRLGPIDAVGFGLDGGEGGEGWSSIVCGMLWRDHHYGCNKNFARLHRLLHGVHTRAKQPTTQQHLKTRTRMLRHRLHVSNVANCHNFVGDGRRSQPGRLMDSRMSVRHQTMRTIWLYKVTVMTRSNMRRKLMQWVAICDKSFERHTIFGPAKELQSNYVSKSKAYKRVKVN